MEDIKVSAVVVTYYTGPILGRCIESVLRQKGLHELIIVNNGNFEDVVEKYSKLSEKDEKVKLIDGQGNIGFSSGCNIGSKEATGDYIVLIKPNHVLISDDVFLKTEEALKEKPQAVLAGIRSFNPDGSLYEGNKKNLTTPKTLFSEFSGLHKITWFFGFIGVNQKEEIDEKDNVFADGISSGYMMMRAMKFRDAGGLDENCFLYGEDMDLCMRIYKRGGKILYVPSAEAIRFKSNKTISDFSREIEQRQGILHYLIKHYRQPMPPLSKKAFHDSFYKVTVGTIKLFSYVKSSYYFLKSWSDKSVINEQNRKIKIKNQILEEKIKTPKSTIKNSEPVFLTGATSHVGVHILRRLLADGVKTYALYNKKCLNIEHNSLTWLHGDLESGFFNFDNIETKTLIHSSDIWLLPKHLKRFSDMGVKRVVCFSSSSGDAGSFMPKNKYEQEISARAKKAEEVIKSKCADLGMNCTILSTPIIYGDGLGRTLTPFAKFIKSFGFLPVPSNTNGKRNPVHGEDVAMGTLKILNMRKTFGKTYRLGGEGEITYNNIIKKIFLLLGKKERMIKIPFLDYLLDAYSFISGKRKINGDVIRRMAHDKIYDIKGAEEDFKYKPREFLSGGLRDFGL